MCHGHLSPKVVHVSYKGDVRVSGFGMAPLTGSATLAASSGYAAPEGKATPRGDAYGLAACLYASLTGLTPDKVLTFGAMELPDALNEVMMRASEQSLGKRKVTGMELEHAFGEVSDAVGRKHLAKAMIAVRKASISGRGKGGALSGGRRGALGGALSSRGSRKPIPRSGGALTGGLGGRGVGAKKPAGTPPTPATRAAPPARATPTPAVTSPRQAGGRRRVRAMQNTIIGQGPMDAMPKRAPTPAPKPPITSANLDWGAAAQSASSKPPDIGLGDDELSWGEDDDQIPTRIASRPDLASLAALGDDIVDEDSDEDNVKTQIARRPNMGNLSGAPIPGPLIYEDDEREETLVKKRRGGGDDLRAQFGAAVVDATESISSKPGTSPDSERGPRSSRPGGSGPGSPISSRPSPAPISSPRISPVPISSVPISSAPISSAPISSGPGSGPVSSRPGADAGAPISDASPPISSKPGALDARPEGDSLPAPPPLEIDDSAEDVGDLLKEVLRESHPSAALERRDSRPSGAPRAHSSAPPDESVWGSEPPPAPAPKAPSEPISMISAIVITIVTAAVVMVAGVMYVRSSATVAPPAPMASSSAGAATSSARVAPTAKTSATAVGSSAPTGSATAASSTASAGASAAPSGSAAAGDGSELPPKRGYLIVKYKGDPRAGGVPLRRLVRKGRREDRRPVRSPGVRARRHQHQDVADRR